MCRPSSIASTRKPVATSSWSGLKRTTRPAVLNLIHRHEVSDVLTQAKYFIPLHEMMAKAGVKPLDTSEPLR
jgi:hypothetical protein